MLLNVKNVIKRKSMKEKGRRWDGRSRIATEQYKNNYDAIFKKKKCNDGKRMGRKINRNKK